LARRAIWGNVALTLNPRGSADPMVRFLKFIIIAPIAIVFLIFCFANRHIGSISFNPFEGDIPELSLQAPMFIIILLAVAVGVIAGSVATWISQGRHRRALRALRHENERLQAELQVAKAALPAIPGLARRA
jgi:uncharacterized integral membrane protein